MIPDNGTVGIVQGELGKATSRFDPEETHIPLLKSFDLETVCVILTVEVEIRLYITALSWVEGADSEFIKKLFVFVSTSPNWVGYQGCTLFF